MIYPTDQKAQLSWNGSWEIRDGREICRWMFAWFESEMKVTGCVGGYSGGGSFQLEKFHISDSRISLEANDDLELILGTDELIYAEDAQTFVLDFHDTDLWLDADNLVLNRSQAHKLIRDGDMLFGGNDLPLPLMEIFKVIGLISKPLI